MKLRSLAALGALALHASPACAQTSEPPPAPEGSGAIDAGPLVSDGASQAGTPAAPLVHAVRNGDGWQLMRNGEPYRVIGAGFGGDVENLDALAEAGANSIRTWSVEDAGLLLDEAMDRGMTVMVGIWLGHAAHGFDYRDPEQVAQQLADARAAVTRYRNHPALLAWGVGNEMEMGNDTPEVWAAVEGVAAMVKEVDPEHPTVIVTAELGEANAARIRELTPSIDIWGINSYNGVYSLEERLTDQGWTGPYIVTEFGQGGGWEVATTEWGAPVEANSAERARAYSAAYASSISTDTRCLGSYAFHWGNNRTPLDTWYALLTPTGAPTEPAHALREVWGGPAPANATPHVEAWSFSGEGLRVPAGAPLEASLSASDTETLRYTWVVHEDTLDQGSGAGTPALCEESASGQLAFSAPRLPGPYRVLGVARDPSGAAALASGRFFVEGDAELDATLPFRVDDHFVYSGWMGDAAEGGLTREDCDLPVDYCSDRCHAFTYARRSQGWAGVAWHAPSGNWDGSEPGVRIPTGAVAVEFLAWGEDGGERVSFYAGNADAGESSGALENQRLRQEPRRYRIELAAGESEDITSAFSWVAGANGEMTFYIRDIRWVAE